VNGVDRDSQLAELTIQRLTAFGGRDAAVDQQEAVGVADQVGVDKRKRAAGVRQLQSPYARC
jgi:hypothetical protein